MQAKDVGTKGLDHRSITLLDKWRFVMQSIPDKRLTAGDLRCLVAIADCYNSNKGRAWPSYSYISQKTGLSSKRHRALSREAGRPGYNPQGFWWHRPGEHVSSCFPRITI